MRFSRVVQMAAVAAVAGSCSLWAADMPKTAAQSPKPTAETVKPAADLAVVEAPAANAATALGEPIRELNVDGKSLSQVLDYLRTTTGTNMVVNWTVLEAAGITKDTPITLQVRDVTLRKLLRLVLDQASPATALTFGVDSNVIEITSQDDADKVLITKVYVVDDLVMTDNDVPSPPQMNLQTVTANGTTTGGSSGGGGGTGGASAGGGGLFGTQQTAPTQPKQTSDQRGADLVALIRDIVRPTIWKENGGPASIKYFSGKLIVTAPVSVQESIGGPVQSEGGQRIGM
jgi:uncharacterized membrane protein YgcG